MKNIVIIGFMLFMPVMVMGCKPQPKRVVTFQDEGAGTAFDDEKDFYMVLKQFKKEVAGKNFDALSRMMSFPFYTSQQQLPNGTTGSSSDPISPTDFNTYKSDIFNKEVIRLINGSKADNLSEIDNKTDDPYYLSLKRLTDKGSKLYELYTQYAEGGNQSDSYFAFVFGRVKGKYKAIAYYAKWPVK